MFLDLIHEIHWIQFVWSDVSAMAWLKHLAPRMSPCYLTGRITDPKGREEVKNTTKVGSTEECLIWRGHSGFIYIGRNRIRPPPFWFQKNDNLVIPTIKHYYTIKRGRGASIGARLCPRRFSYDDPYARCYRHQGAMSMLPAKIGCSLQIKAICSDCCSCNP